MNQEFCKTFWLPYLNYGTIVPDSDNPEKPSRLVRLTNIIKINWTIVIATLLAFGIFLSKNGVQRCVGLLGETAWIYAGELDQTTRRFKGELIFERESANLSASGVERGEWIRLITSRKTMILDYEQLGTRRAMDSPFTLNGHVNYTCRILQPGERLYVAEVDVNGPSLEESHMWLRVRATLPGGN